MSTPSFIQSSLQQRQAPLIENKLRPRSFKEFIGQEKLRLRLSILMEAARGRQESLGHLLLFGPPGLGKTTIAHLIAKEMDGPLVVTSGAVLEKAGDLAGLLTSLKPGSVLFIDEIHRLAKVVEEYLYPAMEDFSLDLVIDSGPAARTVQVKLPPFTLIGATTRSGLISAPLRSRFCFMGHLEYYPVESLTSIVQRAALLVGLSLEEKEAILIAQRARGTPRIANHLVNWVRDFSQTRSQGTVDHQVVKEAMHLLAIDEKGLDERDNRLLEILIDHYNGGPVGVNTLSIALGEEAHTVEEVYEPYLVMQGLIQKTSKGRIATALAYEHIKKRRLNE